MSNSVPSSPPPQPGRISRSQAADQIGWTRWLPGLHILREYDLGWLRHDILAGLVLTTMLVPVGIAYAVASGVSGIYGLYATIITLLAYALFGPSRILVLGPDSALVAVILAVVLQQSGGDPLCAIATAMLDGMANWTTFTVGAATLAVILLLKGHKRIPGILIAVVGATVVVGALDLAVHAGVSVLGSLPQGLPAFAIPWITTADIVPVLIGGCAVALVSFADTSVLSRVYAARTRSYVDPNQEMVGLGVANLAAGFFQGFPISSSSSRTPVAEAAGARTQLTGVVGALAVALLLVVAPDLLRNLPTSALAGVVIASAVGLFEFTDLRRIYRIQRWECRERARLA